MTVIRPLADAAAILLIIETCILGLVPLALLAGMTYGVMRVMDPLRRILKRGQDISARIARQSADISNKAAQPIINVSSRAAAAQAWMDKMGEPISTEAEWTGRRRS